MIWNYRIVLFSALAVLAVPILAQTPPDDPATTQAVGLFVQSCVPFAGDATGLRKWIAERHLPQIPAEQAAAFLGGLGNGQVFGASNAAGKYALVSYDIGACKVVGMEGNMQSAENILSAFLTANGYVQTPMTSRERPDAAMQLYHVTQSGRAWLLSVISHSHGDASGLGSELDLVATPAGKMPH